MILNLCHLILQKTFRLILGNPRVLNLHPESESLIVPLIPPTVTAGSTTSARQLASCGGERVSERCHCKVFCQNLSKVLIGSPLKVI